MMQLTKSKKLILKSVLFCTIFAFCLSGCKGKGDGKIGDLPGNFNSMTTAQKMDTLFAMYPVNEVAEFICDAALKKSNGVNLDFTEAYAYAFTKLTSEEDQADFIEAYEQYLNTLPLSDKMTLYKLGGSADPLEKVAYEMGLQFLPYIRENHKSVQEIQKELEAFKKLCQNDPDFFRRFMIGFKFALEQDKNIDLDKNIYQTFINYEDTIR